MTIISITKNRIMKAIKEEPMLNPGMWATLTDEFSERFEEEFDKKYPNADWQKMQRLLDKKEKSIKVKSKDCAVCAVGSVMRNCIDPNQSWQMIEKASRKSLEGVDTFCPLEDEFGLYTSPEEGLVKEGRYMQALSDFFEQTWAENHENNRVVSITKRKTIAFVKKHFPYKIKIDINGATPAKDVSVVSKKK